MGNKTEKILSQITQSPAQIRLGQVATLIDDLKKKKREFENKVGRMASMADLEKAEELELINTEISRLIKLQKGLKSGNIKPEDAVLIQTVVNPKKVEEPKSEIVKVDPKPIEPVAVVTPTKEVTQEPVAISEPVVITEENKEPTAEVTTENLNKSSEFNKLKEERRNRDIEAIKFGKEIGSSKEALEAMNLSRELIDEIYDAKEEPAVDQKKMDALVEMVVARNNDKKERQRKLAELIVLREQLLAQEGAEKVTLDTETAINTTQEDRTSEDLIDIEKIRSEFTAKQEEIEKLEKEKDKLSEINHSDKLWQNIKSAFNPYWWGRDIKIGKLNKKIQALKVEQAFWKGRLDMREINLDEKNRPFLYFIAEKVQNPSLVNTLKRAYGNTDLRWAEWMTPEESNFEVEKEMLSATGDNEGFFEFNIFGFTKILKNVNEVQFEEDGKKFIAVYSPEAIYKIIGPDGTIIADNIKGYQEATEVYDNETESYKKKVEEEWNKLNKK